MLFFQSKFKFLSTALSLLAVLFVLPSVCSCSGRKYNLPVSSLQITKSDGSVCQVSAEIAQKKEERNYGFMNRKNIPDGTGMLFVFEKDQILSFWMKDTPHPLSIAYIDSKGRIADILDMTPFSLTAIKSSRSVRFALEVPQGWFTSNGISVGDVVTVADGKELRSFCD